MGQGRGESGTHAGGGSEQTIPDLRQEPRLDVFSRQQLSQQVGDLMGSGYT